MTNLRQVGTEKEEMAAQALLQRGYLIEEKNFRCRLGEIDLIARQDGYLVFVEVKYRSSKASGSGAEAVDLRKQRIICKVADYYRMKKKIPVDFPCRFDVVAIEKEQNQENITLYTNAFDYIGNGVY